MFEIQFFLLIEEISFNARRLFNAKDINYNKKI